MTFTEKLYVIAIHPYSDPCAKGKALFLGRYSYSAAMPVLQKPSTPALEEGQSSCRSLEKSAESQELRGLVVVDVLPILNLKGQRPYSGTVN